jgi:2-oxoglutarate ferredoxin oxidoreductase subunit alpha
MDRGKVLWETDLERLNGQWSRYRDLDGDSIPYRTVPGNRHHNAAYFTRGTGHDENARYSEDAETWNRLLDRLKQKHDFARTLVPAPYIEKMDGARIGIIAFGSTEPAVQEARHQLAEQGLPTDFMRIRAVPFSAEVEEFVRSHERCYVIEQNRDGQLHQLLTLDYPDRATCLISAAYTDGLPETARRIRQAVLAKEAN